MRETDHAGRRASALAILVVATLVAGCTPFRAGERGQLAIGHAPTLRAGELHEPPADAALAVGTRATITVRGLVDTTDSTTSSRALEGTDKRVDTSTQPELLRAESDAPGIVRIVETAAGQVVVEAVAAGEATLTLETSAGDDRFRVEVAAPTQYGVRSTAHADATDVAALLQRGEARSRFTIRLAETLPDTASRRAAVAEQTRWPEPILDALERGAVFYAGSPVTFDLVRRDADGVALAGLGAGELVTLAPETAGAAAPTVSEHDQIEVRFATPGDATIVVAEARHAVHVVDPGLVSADAVLTLRIDTGEDADASDDDLALAWLLLQGPAGELVLVGDDPGIVRSVTPDACEAVSYASLRVGAAAGPGEPSSDLQLDALIMVLFDTLLAPNGLLLQARGDGACSVQVSIGDSTTTFQLPPLAEVVARDGVQRFEPDDSETPATTTP